MAYAKGIVRGASIAMVLFSILLLSFFVGCTNSCRFATVSLYSPIWTSIWGIIIGGLGIQMSRSQAENRWGGWFLGLCILSVFISLGCLILSLVTSFFELLASTNSSTTTTYQLSPTPTPTSPHVAPSYGNPEVAGALWFCMMVTSFAIMIISIISSCMYCCCQEPSPPRETHVVLPTGAVSSGQMIIVNSQEFVLQPVAPGGQTTVITGVPTALNDQPPPYSSIVDINKQGNMGANVIVTSYPQNQPVNPPLTHIPNAPVANAPSHQYMELQRNDQNQQEYLQPLSAPPQEYTYVDDSERDRERIPTPDEIYDDVGLPERPSPNDTNSPTYTYASSEDHTGQSQPSPGQSNAGNMSDRPVSHDADPSYSYADNNTVVQQPASDGNRTYANDGLVRAPRHTRNQNEQLPKLPGEEQYLEILP